MTNCLRYLKMQSFSEIYRMTLYEYSMRMSAYWLSRVDREYEIHLQAWANWNVKATKRQGKNKRVAVFKTFQSFFDYKKRLMHVTEGCSESSEKARGLIDILIKQQERRESDGKL